MMGGSIGVASEPGRGSTFTIRLPAEVIDPGAAMATTAGSVTESIVAGRSSVLVIDDDPFVRDLMQRFLTKEGFHVALAANGEEGLRMARQLRPDAITLDVMMPGLDGWTVLSSLKVDAETRDIPVVLVTIVDNKTRGYALGASDYLTKPIDRDRLTNVLGKYRCDRLPCTVLVVEDDGPTREMFRRMLSKEGWGVIEAENGRVALERVAEMRPEVILLDLMMPELDGFEFVVELNRRLEWRTIPVVVVTAKDLTAEDRLRLNGYVEKIIQKGDGGLGGESLLSEVRDLVVLCVQQNPARKS